MQDLAWTRPQSRDDGLRAHPPRRPGVYMLWCWIDMQDLVSSWIHRRCYRVSHGARKRQASCGSAARPQAVDAQRVRREDRLGMAKATGSPTHACAYHSSVHLAAERSPE